MTSSRAQAPTGRDTVAVNVTPLADAFDVDAVRRRLEAGSGGYEIVHESPGLELGVYVLVAPDPDKQEPHDRDEVYVVLEGEGVLTVEGKELQLSPGDAAFVAAGDDHRFSRYERLVLFVLFDNTTKTE